MSSKFVFKSQTGGLSPSVDPQTMLQAMASILKTYKGLHPDLQRFIEFVEVKEHNTDDRHTDGRYIAVKIVLSGVINGETWKEETKQGEKPSLTIDTHNQEDMKAVGTRFERCVRGRLAELSRERKGESDHFRMLAELRPEKQ